MGCGVTVMRLSIARISGVCCSHSLPEAARHCPLHRPRATASIDASIDRARHEIELLGEYRTRLIADVVTGKLDVREVAADLPEVDPADLEDIIEIDDATADEFDAELEEVAP